MQWRSKRTEELPVSDSKCIIKEQGALTLKSIYSRLVVCHDSPVLAEQWLNRLRNKLRMKAEGRNKPSGSRKKAAARSGTKKGWGSPKEHGHAADGQPRKRSAAVLEDDTSQPVVSNVKRLRRNAEMMLIDESSSYVH